MTNAKYITGDGRKFADVESATAHANAVSARTGVIISVERSERETATDTLRTLIPAGAKVWTVIRHVTRSGGASVSAHVIEDGEPRDISYLVARTLGFRMDPDHGGVKVGYMGERRDSALIHDLARALHGSSTSLDAREL